MISLRTADPTEQTEVILNGGYEFSAQEKLGREFSGAGDPGPNFGWRRSTLTIMVSSEASTCARWIRSSYADNQSLRYKSERDRSGTALFNPQTLMRHA